MHPPGLRSRLCSKLTMVFVVGRFGVVSDIYASLRNILAGGFSNLFLLLLLDRKLQEYDEPINFGS